MEKFYTCSCYFTDNIFLEEYKLHVRFVSERQFRTDYQNILRSLGCVSESQFRDVLGKILLDELGFDESFITPLREVYLRPLTALLYSDCGGNCLDSHKAFVVKYAMREDLDLSYHYDNAEVTLNVSLGKDFMEGNLFFGDMRQVPLSETECVEVEHHVTEGLLHRGQHMHGALPISSGTRWNLIIWMRASRERNKLCPMCGKRPTLVESDGFSDGFTMDPDDTSSTWSCSLT
ncbi:2-oxoglutarate and iron-dependent oxygenase domain-containing 2 isoform X1 [Labeo rohita]|uniref:2-oxoglutarate and iron-dependent oxygenase domain-containing 2 isoform X1 n=1 Tax=Labeo rohita TaxID=84645 RepID=A0A498MMK0_LABRO|nr:2-oxoglutarate and iron-dependent oxygenase domain-containing 2 isoform X1 [Labeo rohita]